MHIYAQNEHLKFKGVPIDGTRNEFVQKMKTAGFTYDREEEDVVYMKGDFAGMKGCMIGVTTLKSRDLVCKVSVSSSIMDTWASLETQYQSLKNMLSQKYEKPTEVKEIFDSSYKLDNNDKMYELSSDRGEYCSVFKLENGYIYLSISAIRMKGAVVLTYVDRINGVIIQQDAINDL